MTSTKQRLSPESLKRRRAHMKRQRAKGKRYDDRLAKRIRKLWRDGGPSPPHVAKRSGIAEKYIVGYKNGRVPETGPGRLCLNNGLDLCRGLNTTLDYLMGRDPRPANWATQVARFRARDRRNEAEAKAVEGRAV